jgi:hypothetical protein
MSVDFQRTTRRYIPEDRSLHNQRCENLKSYVGNIFLPTSKTQCRSITHVPSLSIQYIMKVCKDRGDKAPHILNFCVRLKTKKTTLRDFGPRTNYTDRAIAACWRSSVNFCRYRVLRGKRNGFPRSLSRFSRLEPLLFLPSSSSVVLTRLSGPDPDPLLLRKSGSTGNRTQDLWICSQKL